MRLVFYVFELVHSFAPDFQKFNYVQRSTMFMQLNVCYHFSNVIWCVCRLRMLTVCVLCVSAINVFSSRTCNLSVHVEEEMIV